MRRYGLFFSGAALLLFLGLLASSAFFGLTRDRLFFHSDLWSLCLTLAFLGVSASAAPILAWAIICRVHTAAAARIERGLASLSTFAVLAGFMTACLASMALALRQDWALALLRTESGFAASLLAIGAVSAYVGVLGRNRDIFQRRTRILSRAIGAAAVLVVPLGVAVNHAALTAAENAVRPLVVLLVLDGLPARYLHHFGSPLPETELDRQLAAADKLLATRSSAVWTFGWFGSLYSGSTKAVLHPHLRLAAPDNLFATVQQSGATARWMVFHQNGIPEASAGHVSAYDGLRSSFLTPEYTWIPRLLGLDYHVVLPNPGIRSLLLGRIAAAVFDALNQSSSPQGMSLEALVREVSVMASGNRGGLLIFHVPWKLAPMTRESAEAQAGTSDFGWADEADGRIEIDDYYYPSEATPEIARRREALRPAFEATGVAVKELRSELAAKGWKDRLSLFITADHGSALEQGRLAYGYHPIEAVAQTPLAIFGPAHTRIQKASLDTPRLADSLVRAVTGMPAERTGRRTLPASITLKSDDRSEWFLVIADGDRIVRANIHPASMGDIESYRLAGYTATPTPRSDTAIDQARALVRSILPRYGIKESDVHASFHIRNP